MAVRSQGRALSYDILKRSAQGIPSLSHLLENIDQQEIENRELSLAYELIMGVTRWLKKIDYILSLFSKKSVSSLDIPVKTALRLGVYQMFFLERIPHRAAIDESVELVKKDKGLSGASFVNGVLRRISREASKIRFPERGSDSVRRLTIMTSHPEWMVSRWLERFGESEAEEILNANNSRPATSLWVNRKRYSMQSLIEGLREEGVEVIPSRYIDDALTVKTGSVHRTDIFRKGGCYIQDEASQMIPLIFGSELYGKAADLCAAPGGKSLKLAQLLSGDGFIVGIDLSFSRLLVFKENIARLNVENIFLIGSDSEKGTPLKCPFDLVLVDAPCSGTGVIRRNPDIKWRLRQEDIISHSARQVRILEEAKKIVKRGGLLLYSVCSIEKEETEAVVASFLSADRRFRLEDPGERLPERARQFVCKGPYFRTFPHRDGLDGFFAALLKRTA